MLISGGWVRVSEMKNKLCKPKWVGYPLDVRDDDALSAKAAI